MIDYDLELRHHNEALRLAYGIRPSDRVLDVGCGSGQTTREAARMASEGAVVGMDRSEAMVERAVALTRAAGIRNVEYECRDVERHAFAPDAFDVAISRFGTMFFADPIAAFTNVRRALRPDGRLVMMVWQARHRNEWTQSIARALTGDPAPLREAEQAFSLGDPDTVERIFQAAGFEALAFDEVRAPVCYGPDADAALAFVSQFANVSATVGALGEPERERALGRLCQLFETHRTPEGVCFDSRAWIVKARRP
jgi:SAM-dependent methyltransferase